MVQVSENVEAVVQITESLMETDMLVFLLKAQGCSDRKVEAILAVIEKMKCKVADSLLSNMSEEGAQQCITFFGGEGYKQLKTALFYFAQYMKVNGRKEIEKAIVASGVSPADLLGD
jgi:hypothetical protein